MVAIKAESQPGDRRPGPEIVGGRQRDLRRPRGNRPEIAPAGERKRGRGPRQGSLRDQLRDVSHLQWPGWKDRAGPDRHRCAGQGGHSHGHPGPEPVGGSQLSSLERHHQGRRYLFRPAGDRDTNVGGDSGHDGTETRNSAQGHRHDGRIAALDHAHRPRGAAAGGFEVAAGVSHVRSMKPRYPGPLVTMQLAAVVLVLGTMVATPSSRAGAFRPSSTDSSAQENRAADEGARTSPQGARRQGEGAGLVFKDRLTPHWFDHDTRFWYRNDLRGGVREFILVDPERGSRETPFNHARLAAGLSNAAGAAYRSARLPVATSA